MFAERMPANISRREILRRSSSGFGLVSLAALMAEPSWAGVTDAARLPAKVKNVIFCFMPGGVSHIDTFDPKPKLAELDGKPFDGFYQVGAKKETNRKWVKSPWSSGPLSSAAPRTRPSPTAAITTKPPSPSGWPAEV